MTAKFDWATAWTLWIAAVVASIVGASTFSVLLLGFALLYGLRASNTEDATTKIVKYTHDAGE